MKEDDKLQREIEGGAPANNQDGYAYQMVFKALKKEKAGELPADFADRVVASAHKHATAKRSLLEVFLAVAGGIFICVGLVFTITVTSFRLDFGFLSSIGQYRNLFIFAVILIVLLNIIDKQVTRKKAPF